MKIQRCPLGTRSLLEWYHHIANVKGYRSIDVKELCFVCLMEILKRGSVNERNLAHLAGLIRSSSDREASG